MTNIDPETGEVIAPASIPLFSDYLSKVLKKGAVDAELAAALAEVCDAVKLIRKPGKLTFTLTIEPYKAESALVDADSIVVVTEKIDAKIPTETRPGDLQFIHPGGNLSKKQPNQGNLALGN